MDIRALVHSHGQIRREQWHGHQSSDNRQSILSIRPRSLAEHLPVLYHEQERRRCDEDILIERFVAECPEIYPRCRFNPLREEDIREVYYVTIRELSRSSSSSLAASSSSSNTFHNDSLTHLWLQQLQRLMLLDQQQSSSSQTTSHHHLPHPTIFLHRRSNHLFRALAEVSFTNQNLRIGHILYTFFLRHASHIVSTETSATIGQWCNAILRARMTEMQRVECLRRVCEVRPDLPESLRRYGRRGRLVAEMMERAMMIVRFEMARGENGGGYRGRVGLGQRRPGGGLGVHFRSRSTDGVGVGGILRGGGGLGGGIESAGLGTIGSYNNNDRRTTFLSARGLGAGRGGGLFSAANDDDDGLDELRVLHDLNDLALHTAGGSSNATENLNPLFPENLLEDQQQHRLWELSMGSDCGPQYASSSRYFGINTNGMGRSILDEMYNHKNNNNNNTIFTPMGDGVENGGMGILLEGFGGGGGGGVSSLCLDDSSLDLYGI